MWNSAAGARSESARSDSYDADIPVGGCSRRATTKCNKEGTTVAVQYAGVYFPDIQAAKKRRQCPEMTNIVDKK